MIIDEDDEDDEEEVSLWWWIKNPELFNPTFSMEEEEFFVVFAVVISFTSFGCIIIKANLAIVIASGWDFQSVIVLSDHHDDEDDELLCGTTVVDDDTCKFRKEGENSGSFRKSYHQSAQPLLLLLFDGEEITADVVGVMLTVLGFFEDIRRRGGLLFLWIMI